MMSVLVDTSVWIAFFRAAPWPWKKQLRQLLRQAKIVTVDPIVAELLYGAKGDKEQSSIKDLAGAIPVLANTTQQWTEAGLLGRSLRDQGLTLSIVDCFIAASAKQNKAWLWTLDQDFDPLFAKGIVVPFRPE